MSGFREKTLNALGWSVGSQAARLGISFIVGVILARLLSPQEFGLVAMVTVITGFAVMLSDLGFGAALIQRKDVEPRHYSSVFWVNVITGAVLTAGFAAASPLIADFYDRDELVAITLALSANFFIGSLAVVQRTRFSKALDFRRLAFVEVVSMLGAGIAAVWLAAAGWGVWSLVVQSLLMSVLAVVLLWAASEWRPTWRLDRSALGDLIGFSSAVIGNQTLNYWVRNIDSLLVGRLFGENALGNYNRAYSMMLFPLQNVSAVVGRVMFPALSEVKDDTELVARVFMRATRAIALLTFPMMTGLLVTAEDFTIGVLGSQWSGMIPILEVLCIVGAAQSVMTLNGSVYQSQGRADLQLKVGFFLKGISIAGILIGLRWGPVGVASGYACAAVVNSYPAFRFAGGLVGLTYSDLVRSLAPILLCAVGMAAGVWGVGELLGDAWPHLARLAVQVVAGVVLYGVLVRVLRLRALDEVLDVVGTRGPWRAAK